MRQRLKQGVVAVFVIMLALPMIQRWTRLFPEPKLFGVELPLKKTPWTVNAWFNGELQQKLEEKFNAKLGFRAVFVRTDNQINFTFFRRPPAHQVGTQVIVGKDNWLYEGVYVERYNVSGRGTDEWMRRWLGKIKRIQDLLRSHGVGFLVVLAPSKVELYPEYVPEGLLLPGRENRRSDYDHMVPIMREMGIHFVDGRALFFEMKNKGPIPLFPRGGIHWNYYGAALVVERMIDQLETITGENFVNIRCTGATANRHSYGTDNDLGELLNIWTWKFHAGLQYHPVIHVVEDEGARRPNLLIAGDSFVFTLTELMDRYNLYEKRDTFYYFKRRFTYPDKKDEPIRRDQLDMAKELFQRDAVIFELNEYWMPNLGFGMVEPMLEVLEKERVSSPSSAP